MIKNQIIEMYSEEIKVKLYSALNSNQLIYGTKNRRGIPMESFITEDSKNYIELVINPVEKLLCYTDFRIFSITEAISELMPIEELQEYFNNMDKESFIKAIESMLHLINYQFSSEDIYNYLISLSLNLPEVTEAEADTMKHKYLVHDVPQMPCDLFPRIRLTNEELKRIENILLYQFNFDVKVYKDEQEQYARKFIESCRNLPIEII